MAQEQVPDKDTVPTAGHTVGHTVGHMHMVHLRAQMTLWVLRNREEGRTMSRAASAADIAGGSRFRMSHMVEQSTVADLVHWLLAAHGLVS